MVREAADNHKCGWVAGENGASIAEFAAISGVKLL
jgi:hypothetical protein